MLKKIALCALIVSSLTFAREATQPQAVQSSKNFGFAKDGVWTQQDVIWSTDKRGIRYIDAVDENVAWGIAVDGSGNGDKIQEMTVTSDAGLSWSNTEIPNMGTCGIANVTAVDEYKAWVAMYPTAGPDLAKQGVWATTDGGNSWAKQESAPFSTDNSFINVIHFFNENDGFCQGDPIDGYFELYTTTDGGTTWIRVPQENIPENLSGEYGTVGYYDTVGDTIWFGTNKGRVYKSIDKGINWTVSTTVLGTTQTQITFSDALNGLAQDKGETSVGTLNKTTDGGETWQAVNHTGKAYLYCITDIPGSANTYISAGVDIEHEMTGASYSFDGGETWTTWEILKNVQVLGCRFPSNARGWAGTFMIDGAGGILRYDGELMDIEEQLAVPSVVTLDNNYPNPFNPSTTINFALKADANVNLTIFDAAGKTVSEMINSKMVQGEHKVDFHASNLAAGVYYYTINANGFKMTKKMVLTK